MDLLPLRDDSSLRLLGTDCHVVLRTPRKDVGNGTFSV